MTQLTCELSLDVSQLDSGITLTAKKGDAGSRALRVWLTGCGEELSVDRESKALLVVKKGEEIKSFFGNIHEDGSLLFTLPNFVVSNEGSVLCEVAIVGTDESRLTSSSFTIQVESGVCADVDINYAGRDETLMEKGESTKYSTLGILIEEEVVTLMPQSNRIYLLDMRGADYILGNTWKRMIVTLPTPTDLSCENKILIHVYAPIMDFGSKPDFFYGDNCAYRNGELPYFEYDHFDLEFTYMPVMGKWCLRHTSYL